jgi:hypothetical protein
MAAICTRVITSDQFYRIQYMQDKTLNGVVCLFDTVSQVQDRNAPANRIGIGLALTLHSRKEADNSCSLVATPAGQRLLKIFPPCRSRATTSRR